MILARVELGTTDHGGILLEATGEGEHSSGRDKLAKLRSRQRNENETVSPHISKLSC